MPTEQSESSEVSETAESSEESSGTTEAPEITQARANLEAAQAEFDALDAELWRIYALLDPYMKATDAAYAVSEEAWEKYVSLPEDATEEEKAIYKQAWDEATAKFKEAEAVVNELTEEYKLYETSWARIAAREKLKAAQAAYDEAVATYGTP